MANLAQFDFGTKGIEIRTRALLEDLIEYHKGVYPHNRLALAIWFEKSAGNADQYVLELFSGGPKEGIATARYSLLWKTGSDSPPFVNVHAAGIDFFSKLLRSQPQDVQIYQRQYEVLYFDKNLLTQDILSTFQVVTEPPGLMKGWYISEEEYTHSKNVQELLSRRGHIRPELGLVKIGETADFEYCRGLLHVETSQKWLPLSPEGVQIYSYYNDQQKARSVYFLFEGGALYQVLKFEVKTAPEYASKFGLLENPRNDRYPEVYLRAVHPPAQSAA